MSASLVGSEMCIRDSRVRDFSPDFSCVVTPLRKRVKEQLFCRGRNQAGRCLLYTSDAADDM
eukprot:13216499-Alexandrium_andersonii.AAC.1